MPKTLTREQLLADLKTGVGGSECHNLFDLEPYGCRRKLWYSKTGAKPDFELHENKDMRRGKFLESHVCKLYAEATGRRLHRSEVVRHLDIPHWICHPDRIIVRRPKGDVMARLGPGLLEVKCPSVRNYLKVRREGLGDGWIMQVQHSLGVTGFKWGSYAVFSAEMWELTHFDVQRDDEVIDVIRKEVERYWRLVENGPAPDRLLPSDHRCRDCPFRTQCQGQALLESIASSDSDFRPGEELPKDYGLAQLAANVAEAKAVAKEAAELEEQEVAKLKDALGTRTAIEVGPGSRVYYRPTSTNRIDAKGLRIKYPAIAAEFETTSIQRPLKLFLS